MRATLIRPSSPRTIIPRLFRPRVISRTQRYYGFGSFYGPPLGPRNPHLPPIYSCVIRVEAAGQLLVILATSLHPLSPVYPSDFSGANITLTSTSILRPPVLPLTAILAVERHDQLRLHVRDGRTGRCSYLLMGRLVAPSRYRDTNARAYDVHTYTTQSRSVVIRPRSSLAAFVEVFSLRFHEDEEERNLKFRRGHNFAG